MTTRQAIDLFSTPESSIAAYTASAATSPVDHVRKCTTVLAPNAIHALNNSTKLFA